MLSILVREVVGDANLLSTYVCRFMEGEDVL